MAFSKNIFTKVVLLFGNFTIPPAPKYLGQGDFFYIFSGTFLGSMVLFCIFWDARHLIFLGIVILFTLCLFSKKYFNPLALLIFIAVLCSIFLLGKTIEGAQKSYELIRWEVLSNKSNLSIFIDESLGIKGGRLVLRGYIVSQPNSRIEIKILPTNTPPEGITLFGVTGIIPASKFQISRGISAGLEGSLINRGAPVGEKSTKYKFAEVISKTLPYPESALMAGMLTGDSRLMDDAFNTKYRLIGLSHLCVVSGSNISFVLVNLCILLFFIPFQYRIPLAITGIIGYIWFVGGDPPVLRAGVMGITGVFSLLYGKRGGDVVRLLILAAVCLVIYSPLSLVYDIGFLLSFFATLGIMVGGEAVRGKGKFTQYWSGSIFAAIWTLPITAGAFGTLHSMSVIANVLVAPVIAIATVFSCLTLLVSPLNSFLGYYLGHISFLALSFIDIIAYTFGELPHQFTIPSYLRAILCLGVGGIILGFSLRFLNPRDQERRADVQPQQG